MICPTYTPVASIHYFHPFRHRLAATRIAITRLQNFCLSMYLKEEIDVRGERVYLILTTLQNEKINEKGNRNSCK